MVDTKPEKQFFLKLDISKFYYRVDHAVLLDIFRRKIVDDDVMWLLNEIVNCEHTSFGLPAGLSVSDTEVRLAEKGMPIGNLTSQMFANVYMNELDQYIKRELGARHYIRYMDDMIVLSDSKDELHGYQRLIAGYLRDNLQLDLNNKTCIRPTTLGIDFLGYKVWSTHIKLRKSTSLRVKRHLKRLSEQYAAGTKNLDEIKEVVSSYHGMLKHCNSYNLRCKISDSFVLKRSSE